LNINVPGWAQAEFWDEPPAGTIEFWAFRFPPPCKEGDKLTFKFNGKVVAEAVVSEVEPPRKSKCDHTGRFLRAWKVFWTPESFVDLREV
jgi:hypothetical protein